MFKLQLRCRFSLSNRAKSAQNFRNIFIQTETTPNPHSIKYLPGKEVLPEAFGTGMFIQRHDKKTIARSPLAKSLFVIDGVKSVFFGRDFITVTKDPNDSWASMKPLIFSAIFDFNSEGQEAVLETPLVSDTTILDTDTEVVAAIKELLETRIRPSIQEDGGDIFFHDFDETLGIVKVRLAGSCVGCPSSTATLKNGVENMLMHYIPEVKGIEEISALLEAEEKEANGGASGDPEDQKTLKFKPEE